MIFILCFCFYFSPLDPQWGYAPSISQLFRAGDDHHDNWQSTLYETSLTVGKASWSKPYGWAYLDMLMTGMMSNRCNQKEDLDREFLGSFIFRLWN
jgi:hypothetical protein